MVLSQDEIIQIITMVIDWHFPVVQVASTYHGTRERVYQLVQSYRTTGIYSVPKRLGRSPNVPSPATRSFIFREKVRLGFGSRALHTHFLSRYGLTIGETTANRCVVLGDASRMILAGGYFSMVPTELSIQLLQEAYEIYEHIALIREVIPDHGSQVLANI